MNRRSPATTRPTATLRALVAVLGMIGALLIAQAGRAETPDGAPGGPPGGRPPRHQGPPHGPPHGPPPIERTLERYADQLQLSEAVRTEIDQLARSSRADTDALRERLRGLHDEMRALLSQDAPDEAAVMAQVEKISASEAELQKLRLRSMLRIRALLTPEQRAQLVRIDAERRERRSQRPPPRH